MFDALVGSRQEQLVDMNTLGTDRYINSDIVRENNVQIQSIINIMTGKPNYRLESGLLTKESDKQEAISIIKNVENNISPKLRSRIKKFGQTIKNMPTQYFEMKPERAVKLNEFVGAIVPTQR